VLVLVLVVVFEVEMLSNPEFGFGTSALEVARVFGDEIRGKCGELFGRFFLFTFQVDLDRAES